MGVKEEEPSASRHMIGMIVVCSLRHVCRGRMGWEVAHHTGKSATEDEKLSALCTLLVTVIDGDAVSKVSTTVCDGCGSPTAGCDS